MNSKRITTAFLWGMVATIIMSIPMVVATATGVSPMPKPIPAAIAGMVLGKETANPALMAFAIITHLAYGGFWSAVLAAATKPVTIWKGLLLGAMLWLIMQVAVLPLLGWGLFGTAITSKIAVATLVLHLIYGGTLGWLIDRKVLSRDAPS